MLFRVGVGIHFDFFKHDTHVCQVRLREPVKMQRNEKKKNICLHNFQFSGCWLSPPTEAVGPKTIEKREPSFLVKMFRLITTRWGVMQSCKSTRASFSAKCFFDENCQQWGFIFSAQFFPTWALRCCRENNAAHDFTWLYIRNNKTRNVYEAQPKHSIRSSFKTLNIHYI